jgi:hypothetical protein
MDSHHNMHNYSILIGSITLMLSSIATYAQYQEIPCTYSSNVTQNEPICGTDSPTGPPTSGPFVDSDNTFTITISSQSGSSISGSGAQAEPELKSTLV